MKKTHFFSIGVALLCLIVLDYSSAWTAPNGNPPANNVEAPINTGSVDQVKSGGVGVDTMAVADGFGFSFTNTGANAVTAYRMANNDGTGNYISYMNTVGGVNPVYETDGFAFKEQYNPGAGGTGGRYNFLTAPAGTAGNAITWTNAFTIFPDGSVGSDSVCMSDGTNCFAPADVSGVSASGVPVYLGDANDVTVLDFAVQGTTLTQVSYPASIPSDATGVILGVFLISEDRADISLNTSSTVMPWTTIAKITPHNASSDDSHSAYTFVTVPYSSDRQIDLQFAVSKNDNAQSDSEVLIVGYTQ